MTTVATMETAAQDLAARHIVPLSGGKDSTALAIYLAQHGKATFRVTE